MHARVGIVVLAIASCAGPARAEVYFRLHSTYLSSRLASGSFRTSDQVLECRTLYHLGPDRSLSFLGQLQREEDFEQRVHVFRGRGDLQFRSTPVDFFFRNRPDQRVSIYQPSGWRLSETAWGGQFHVEGLPNLRFESSKRDREYSGLGTLGVPSNSRVDEQRLMLAHRMRGIDFDYSERWQDSRSIRSIPGIPAPGASPVHRKLRETQFGADAQHNVGTWMTTGLGARHVQGRDEAGSNNPKRSFRDDLEGRLNFRPSRIWSVGGDANWETVRYRTRGTADQNDRNLDSSVNARLDPWSGTSFSMVRTYQEQILRGATTVNDYLRAQLVSRRHVCPEMQATATVARNWILAQSGSSVPSDQVGFRLDGPIRPGANLSVDWNGQALEGVEPGQRYRVAQNIELRLNPLDGVEVHASAQSDRLGSRISLRHMDRAFYTVEGILNLRRGGSFTLRYDGHQLREQAAGTKYGVSGSASTPWKWGDLSWNWSAVRASDHDQKKGRDFGITSGGTCRIRFSRAWEFTVSQNRALPSVSAGTSLWSASLLQRF